MLKSSVFLILCGSLVRALPAFLPGNLLEEENLKKLPRSQDGSFDSILKINKKSEHQFFEGDIVLPVGKNAIPDQNMRWGNTIAYKIYEGYSSETANLIRAVLNELEVRTCFKFVEQSNQQNYLYYVKEGGCYSSVGMVGGEQVISIGGGCDNHRIIMHETFHALGFWHEQSRTDRDDWVTIVYENIIPGEENNFAKLDSDEIDLMGSPYDYNSILHYSSTAFSKNGSATIIALKEGGENMGRLDKISEIDLTELNTLYECQETLDSDGFTHWTEWSRCSKTCEMTRERFCDGTECTEFGKKEVQVTGCQDCVFGYDPDCGPATLTSASGNVSSPLFPYQYKINAECTQTITVPEGARVKLVFLFMDLEHYNGDCYYDLVEVFDGSDDQAPRFGEYCGGEPPANLYSSGNSMTIKFKSDESINKEGFFAKYYALYAPSHMCTFDDNDHFCGWENDTTADIPFNFRRGQTQSADTGPLADHTFGVSIGGYLYMEASSPAVNSNKARILSPLFSSIDGEMCFTVWCNMYGINTGSLNAYLEIEDNRIPMFSYFGDTRTREWFKSSYSIVTTKLFRVIIEAIRYDGYKGDIAVDDAMLSEGPCPSG